MMYWVFGERNSTSCLVCFRDFVQVRRHIRPDVEPLILGRLGYKKLYSCRLSLQQISETVRGYLLMSHPEILKLRFGKVRDVY